MDLEKWRKMLEAWVNKDRDQRWGQGYQLALDVLSAVVEDLNRSGVTPSWEVIGEVITELDRLGKIEFTHQEVDAVTH